MKKFLAMMLALVMALSLWPAVIRLPPMQTLTITATPPLR